MSEEAKNEGRKSTVTEQDKHALRDKLTKLALLEAKEHELREKKKKVESDLKQFRPEMGDTLETVGRKRVRHGKTLVSRVPRAQHRKPTLEMTYKAIENILGKEAVEHVAKIVKEEREQIKKRCAKEGTLKIIPTKSLRKTRSDKKPESEKTSKRKAVEHDVPKKLKYLKRKKKSDPFESDSENE